MRKKKDEGKRRSNVRTYSINSITKKTNRTHMVMRTDVRVEAAYIGRMPRGLQEEDPGQKRDEEYSPAKEEKAKRRRIR